MSTRTSMVSVIDELVFPTVNIFGTEAYGRLERDAVAGVAGSGTATGALVPDDEVWYVVACSAVVSTAASTRVHVAYLGRVASVDPIPITTPVDVAVNYGVAVERGFYLAAGSRLQVLGSGALAVLTLQYLFVRLKLGEVTAT